MNLIAMSAYRTKDLCKSVSSWILCELKELEGEVEKSENKQQVEWRKPERGQREEAGKWLRKD